MRNYLPVASNTLFQILSRAATALVGLIVTRLITTSFGLEPYGQYQIILAYVALWWILTDFGLNAVVVREMARDEGRLQLLFNSLFTLRVFLGILLMAFSLLLLFFLPYTPVVKLGISIAAVTILAQAMLGSTHAVFQVKLRYDRQFWANFIGSLFFLALVFWAVRVSQGVLALVGAFTAGYLLMMLASIILVRRWVRLRLSFDFTELRRIFRVTLPFGLALLLSLATFKIDAFLMSVLNLRNWTNEAAVGIYQLAYKIFELVLVVPIFFMNVMYPIWVRHFRQSFPRFKNSFFRTLAVLGAGAAGTAVVVYFLAPWLIGILAQGVEFQPSVRVLRIFALEFLLFYWSAPLMWAILVFEEQKRLIGVYGLAFLFNLTINLWVLPRWAFLGAAVTTGLTEGLILLLLSFNLWRLWPRGKFYD